MGNVDNTEIAPPFGVDKTETAPPGGVDKTEIAPPCIIMSTQGKDRQIDRFYTLMHQLSLPPPPPPHQRLT